jgi:nitrogen fixation NifU-like protein
MSLYSAQILQHARNPKHFWVLADATLVQHGVNQLCGDELDVYLRLDNDLIRALSFTGQGCALCLATASIICDTWSGLEIADFLSKDVAELENLIDIKVNPLRKNCLLLPLQTMQTGLKLWDLKSKT